MHAKNNEIRLAAMKVGCVLMGEWTVMEYRPNLYVCVLLGSSEIERVVVKIHDSIVA